MFAKKVSKSASLNGLSVLLVFTSHPFSVEHNALQVDVELK